jgi:hypothetical protein
MNNAATTDPATQRFADAARNFTPTASPKFLKLTPFRDGIAELRNKGASYAAIAALLRIADVTVSHDTVARYCHDVLGFPRASRRRQRTVDATSAASKRDHGHNGNRGPRVADPETI